MFKVDTCIRMNIYLLVVGIYIGKFVAKYGLHIGVYTCMHLIHIFECIYNLEIGDV